MPAMVICMPKLSASMVEGKVLHWGVKPGDFVAPGDVIGEVEADKANMEIEATEAGYVAEILVGVGESAPVGTPLIRLVDRPEDVVASVDSEASPAPEAVPPVDVIEVDPAVSRSEGTANSGRQTAHLDISPLAAAAAQELGIDPKTLRGSGPGGRIMREDVLAAAAQVNSERSQEKSAIGSAIRETTIDLANLLEIQSPNEAEASQTRTLGVPEEMTGFVGALTFRATVRTKHLSRGIELAASSLGLLAQIPSVEWLQLLAGRAAVLAFRMADPLPARAFGSSSVKGCVAFGIGEPERRRYAVLHGVDCKSLAQLLREFVEARDVALAGALRSNECREAELVVENTAGAGIEVGHVALGNDCSPLLILAMSSEAQLTLTMTVNGAHADVARWGSCMSRLVQGLEYPLLLADRFEHAERQGSGGD